MDYSELGAYLKEERERQGLSLDDIQQKTKISLSSLEAIEEGRINDLPHPVYTKGFIKNYAQCLGLNADELAGTFAQKAGIDEEFEDETEQLPTELRPIKDQSKWTLVSVLVSIVLLAALGWLVYDLFWGPSELKTSSQGDEASQSVEESNDRGQKPDGQENKGNLLANRTGEEGAELNQEAQEGETEAELVVDDQFTSRSAPDEEVLNAAQTPEPENLQQQEEEDSDSEQAGEGQEAERTLSENEQESVASTSGSESESESESESGSGSQPPPGDTKHALQIEANEACWMSANIDSKQRDLYLRPGESVTFRFEQALEIKLGNAGGVKLTFDGQAYPLDADSGEVLSISFP